MLIIGLQDEQARESGLRTRQKFTRVAVSMRQPDRMGERRSRNGHLTAESLTFSVWHVCSDMGDRALTCTRSSCPRRIDETRTEPLNRALYKERNYVERAIVA